MLFSNLPLVRITHSKKIFEDKIENIKIGGSNITIAEFKGINSLSTKPIGRYSLFTLDVYGTNIKFFFASFIKRN